MIEAFESLSELEEKVRRQLIQLALDRWAGAPGDKGSASAAVVAASSPPPALSDEARALLRGAVEDSNGTVLRLRTMGGTSVQTNGKDFAERGNPKSEARWESALRELVDDGLLQDRGYKNEVFGVTHEGYEVAERLE